MSKPSRKTLLPTLANVGRLLLTVFAVALGVLAVWHGWLGQASLVATCGALAVVAVLAANLHLLESFSGFGIKAQTRALAQRLNEADEIMRKVRRIGELAGQSIITHQSALGRSGVQTVAGNYAVAGQIRGMLEEIGSDRESIRAALEPWATWMIRDIAYGYFQRLKIALSQASSKLDKSDPERARISRFLVERLPNAYELEPALFPAYWEEVIRDMPSLTEEDRQLLLREASELRPVVEAIRSRLEIPYPERWIPRIQHVWQTRERNDGAADWTIDGWSRPDPRFKDIP